MPQSENLEETMSINHESESTAVLPSFKKMSENLKGQEESEDSVRKKIEIFESNRKRKADDASRGSPETSPRIRKVAKKKTIKRKMSSTQIMITKMNQNMMKEFRRINENMSNSNNQIIENEKGVKENKVAIFFRFGSL